MGERLEGGTAVHRAVLLAAALVGVALVFPQLVTLLTALLITVILAIVASALATQLERLRVPRVVGVFLALALLVAAFAGAFALVLPPVVRQAERFVDDLPRIVDRAVERVAMLTGTEPTEIGRELQSFLQRYLDQPELLLGPLASIGTTALTILAAIVFILVSAFYMAVRPAPLVEGALRLFPPSRRGHAAAVMERLRGAWLGWLRGVGADMLVSFSLLYLGLSLVDMEFALLFSALSAALVVVPYFGAIVGGIPPVLFALTDSPEKALLVLATYLVVQQVEGNLVVPLVMSQTVKLHPAVIAVGVVVVGALFGVVGLIVSVPLISTAVILTEELWVKPREEAARSQLELPGDPELGPPDAQALPESAAGEPRDDSLSWDQRRFLALLGLPAFALALAITMITTYLPVLLVSLSGPALIGLLIGSEGLIALFVPLIAGASSDETRTRLGRRTPYLLIAAPVAAGALILMPLAGSLIALVVLLVLFYASYFSYYAPYYALYPDLVPDAVRGRSQSFQNTLREIGLGAALVAGGVLLGLWQPLPFLVAALLLLAITLAFVWRIEEPGSDESEGPSDPEDGRLERLRSLVRDHDRLRGLAGAIALWEFSLAALKTFVVLFFTVRLGYSMTHVSGVLGLLAVSVLVAAGVGGKLADRLGHWRLVWMALWVYGIGAAVPAFWHSAAALAIVPGVAFAAGIVMTLSYSMLMGEMPRDSHGAAAGLYGFVRGLGVLLGPLVAGVAITLLEPVFDSTQGYAAVFLVASAGILASIPLMRAAKPAC